MWRVPPWGGYGLDIICVRKLPVRVIVQALETRQLSKSSVNSVALPLGGGGGGAMLNALLRLVSGPAVAESFRLFPVIGIEALPVHTPAVSVAVPGRIGTVTPPVLP